MSCRDLTFIDFYDIYFSFSSPFPFPFPFPFLPSFLRQVPIILSYLMKRAKLHSRIRNHVKDCLLCLAFSEANLEDQSFFQDVELCHSLEHSIAFKDERGIPRTEDGSDIRDCIHASYSFEEICELLKEPIELFIKNDLRGSLLLNIQGFCVLDGLRVRIVKE